MFSTKCSLFRLSHSVKLLVFSFIVLSHQVESQDFLDSRVTIQTTNGVFVGTRESVQDGGRPGRPPPKYFAFKGIPYARPPVGDLRWKDPELLDLGNVTIYATHFGSVCPQSEIGTTENLSVRGNEDCLFLNVFSPRVPSLGRQVSGATASIGASSRSLLPVMVYVHGGSFVVGSSDLSGPRRFMKHNVVLVTINYRLGALGFMSSGDNTIPGNFGALDVITSLQWIQKHIRDFGGNPRRVTLFGSSAGAAIVHSLLLSPKAFGLFTGVILQSGSALCPWAVQKNPLQYMEQIAENLECSGTTEELAECLRTKTSEELVLVQTSLSSALSQLKINTALVIDNEWRGEEAFLPGDPETLMKTGIYPRIPVMLGVTSDEGLGFCLYILNKIGTEKIKDSEYFKQTLIPELVESITKDNSHLDMISKAVLVQYFDGVDLENDTTNVISGLVDLLGDLIFYTCHWDALKKFSTYSRGSIYSYVFTHRTPRSPTLFKYELEKLKQQGLYNPVFDSGVGHENELYYLFEPHQRGIWGTLTTPTDERMAEILTQMWVAFAENGSPAKAVVAAPAYAPWKPVTAENINYYNLTSSPARMGKNYRKGEALFWLRTIPFMKEMGSSASELETYSLFLWIALGLCGFFFLLTLILICILCRRRKTQNVNLSL